MKLLKGNYYAIIFPDDEAGELLIYEERMAV